MLIVDDDERISRIVAQVLSNLGYHVLEAQTGADALDQCDLWKKTIHLLITDVAMPVMDGPEVAKQVQRIRSGHCKQEQLGFFRTESPVDRLK